jgi:hypothetical protein
LRSTDISPEDIVEVLEVVQDPTSVPYVIDALHWQPEWDEFHHFASKCVLALAAIGTDEAIQALRDAAAVGPREVREAASFELEHLGRQTTE